VSAAAALRAAPDAALSAERVLQAGMAFWGSKVLLSAVELGLFTLLSTRALHAAEIERALGLHPRATFDFLDALVATGMLARHGDGPGALYANTAETAAFLDAASPRYVGGMLEMANARLYPFWGDLTEALRSGQPQNEVKCTGKPMFEALYADPARLEQFMGAMSGVSRANFEALADKVDFSPYATLADIGGATGQLSCLVADRHPRIACTTYDLPAVEPIAARHIAAAGLSDRVRAASLDFLSDEFPRADVITMGMILHDWDLDHKRMLIAKAWRALPEGGALIVVENLIDDARRENAFGLLMSLNMLIEFGGAFDFTGADFAGWCDEAGFDHCEVVHLVGPCSAGIAYK
jgi:hypothetical protein